MGWTRSNPCRCSCWLSATVLSRCCPALEDWCPCSWSSHRPLSPSQCRSPHRSASPGPGKIWRTWKWKDCFSKFMIVRKIIEQEHCVAKYACSTIYPVCCHSKKTVKVKILAAHWLFSMYKQKDLFTFILIPLIFYHGFILNKEMYVLDRVSVQLTFDTPKINQCLYLCFWHERPKWGSVWGCSCYWRCIYTAPQSKLLLVL